MSLGWPAGQTAQLTGLCVQFSSLPAGLCLLLSPDSDSSANFGSRTYSHRVVPRQNSRTAEQGAPLRRNRGPPAELSVEHDGQAASPILTARTAMQTTLAGLRDDISQLREELGVDPEPEPEEAIVRSLAAYSVSVMAPSGAQTRVAVSASTTVASVKESVARAGGEVTPEYHMFGATGQTELQNSATMAECGIVTDSLLLLSAPELGFPLDRAAPSVPPAVYPVASSTSSTLRRSVSFSERSQERIADDSSWAVNHFEGETKGNDGPSADSALLDRLIVAFFEKGNIRSAEGVRSFVGSAELDASGPAVAERLEQIVETLRGGRRVGLLPSNARLGPEHAVRLGMLLKYLNQAL
jgi:hypothetical protein